MIAAAVSLDESIATFELARRRGVAFLLEHMNADGSIGPVSNGLYYYRVPWALALSGETAPAMRVTEWIRRHMLTAEGEVAGSASPNGGSNRGANTYAETCLAYGAHLLRQYDVARRAISYGLRFQDAVDGGVYMDVERTGPDDPQILYLTCQLGMSALITGHLESALSAGQFVQRLWDAQPGLPGRLYTIWTRNGGLQTAVPDNETQRRIYVTESQQIRQMHFNGGIAAAFLSRLHLATGDAAWLETARAYQAFSMHSTERQFETKQVCKSAWGGGLLATITHDPRYLDWTARMGSWFVAEQDHDGSWTNTPYLSPNPQISDRIVITAEFVVHLDTIVGALAASSVQ
jgi:hypothetical protein